ncbi:F-box/WD repeat-containing protein 7-like [Rhincodon typus]|uniref:F-box/WD repeat-containing protein 7-like n=1 Tax=Rhincodon typus TaxID=259920 RepID=UPI002030A7E7|nr:F-box/WD repeat-containing protein 7-like [Rhincodon typus]
MAKRRSSLSPCINTATTFGDLRNGNIPGQHRKRITSVAPPSDLQEWLSIFQKWSGPEKLLALDELIDRCETSQIKYMMQVIEPQFQRDFISLLPKETIGLHFGGGAEIESLAENVDLVRLKGMVR